MLEVKNEPKEQVEMRKHKGRHKISPARKRQGREIKERRKALGIAMHELETEANLPKWCLSQMESKGVGLFPDRAAATFEALERLEARKEKYKNGTNYNPLTKQMDNSHKEATPPMSTHQARPSKPRRTGFTISTEHKIKCDDYELVACVAGNDFSISIGDKKDLLIIEGQKSEKMGILAALKAIIEVIEG